MSKPRWLTVEQGSKKWLSLREGYFTASEADAMMGTSKYKTRYDLMVEKKTGVKPEVSDYVKSLFEEGHRLEEHQRGITEEILGFPLEPYTVIKGDYLASLDGASREHDMLWEHKTMNQHLKKHLQRDEVPESHKWQLVHQAYVTGINSILFMASDKHGYFDYTIYEVTEQDKETLIEEWVRFQKELEHFAPPEEAKKVVVESVEEIEITPFELITVDVDFYTNSRQVLNDVKLLASFINTDLVDDEDYALAEKQIKVFKDAEKTVDQMRDDLINNLGPLADTLADLHGAMSELSSIRLTLDKKVKARKDAVKLEAIGFAETELLNYLEENGLEVKSDFHGAIKGKRTTKTMNNAIASHLAECKANARPVLSIALSQYAEKHKLSDSAIDELSKLLSDYGVNLL